MCRPGLFAGSIWTLSRGHFQGQNTTPTHQRIRARSEAAKRANARDASTGNAAGPQSTGLPNQRRRLSTGDLSRLTQNWFFSAYIADKPRFSVHVPKEFLAQLLQRQRLIHVTNPFFHFSVLVPETFELTERVPENRPDTLITSFVNPNYPFPLGTVEIVTAKIPAIRPENLVQDLILRSPYFLRYKMGIRFEGRPDLPAPPPPDDDVALIPDLSDTAPRVHQEGRAVRFWRRYRSQRIPDRDYEFMFAIIDDNFVVVHFAISPRRAQMDNSDLIERFVIASSLSFSH